MYKVRCGSAILVELCLISVASFRFLPASKPILNPEAENLRITLQFWEYILTLHHEVQLVSDLYHSTIICKLMSIRGPARMVGTVEPCYGVVPFDEIPTSHKCVLFTLL